MSTDQMELSGILDDSPTEQPETTPEPQTTGQPPEKEGQPRGPDGKFLASEPPTVTEVSEPPKDAPQTPPQPPQEQFTPRERALLARAQDETRKRQAWEQRARELEQKTQQEEPKDFWDNPQEALQKQRLEVQEMVMNTRLNTAEAIARSKHADFDEKVGIFQQVLQNTPGLHMQWLNAADPAEFAYSLGKNYLDLQQAGNLDTYRAKIEQETRARLEAEYKAKMEQEAKQRAAIPGSLTETTSLGSNKPVWGGPTPMSSILGVDE